MKQTVQIKTTYNTEQVKALLAPGVIVISGVTGPEIHVPVVAGHFTSIHLEKRYFNKAILMTQTIIGPQSAFLQSNYFKILTAYWNNGI